MPLASHHKWMWKLPNSGCVLHDQRQECCATSVAHHPDMVLMWISGIWKELNRYMPYKPYLSNKIINTQINIYIYIYILYNIYIYLYYIYIYIYIIYIIYTVGQSCSLVSVRFSNMQRHQYLEVRGGFDCAARPICQWSAHLKQLLNASTHGIIGRWLGLDFPGGRIC